MVRISLLILFISSFGAAVPAHAQDAIERPEKGSIAYWVGQLGHEHYLRREMAAQKLYEAGPDAIDELIFAIDQGDLEVVERAAEIMTGIAMTRAPSEDGGAWEKLRELANTSAGRAASCALTAVQELRRHRAAQARIELSAAGVFVGMDEFVIRAISQPRMLVQIDEKWRGDVEALQWLAWLEGVENARIKGVGVNQAAMRYITQIPELKSLAIVDGSIDDETLGVLQEMKPLNELEFRYVPLTDEQGERIVAIPLRVSLNLMGTGISAEKVEWMKDAAPGLQIAHRQGGFLGVTCSDGFNLCEIGSVIRGSAAEAGGLIKGDVIVQIDETSVTRFRDLQQAINQHLPGDEVVIKFRRGSAMKSVPLKLRKFEEQ